MKTQLSHAYPDDGCRATGGGMRRAHQRPNPLCSPAERARQGEGHGTS
jgi:hypothetical protein